MLLVYIPGACEPPLLSVARRCGACGAGREGVKDDAVTLYAMCYNGIGGPRFLKRGVQKALQSVDQPGFELTKFGFQRRMKVQKDPDSSQGT